jgi:hypothetical protein
MAIIKPNIIGGISGKVDDKIVRRRYGKYVLYSKPLSYNISYSSASIQNRSKFAETVKFARLLNSIPEIAEIWKSSKIKGVNSYQKIIKHNTKLTSKHGISSFNTITPPGLFALPESIFIDENRLTIRSTIEKDICHSSITLFTLSYVHLNKEKFSFILKSSEIKIINEGCVEAKMNMSEEESNKLKRFDKAIFLSSFVTSKSKDFWTNTFSFELDPLG